MVSGYEREKEALSEKPRSYALRIIISEGREWATTKNVCAIKRMGEAS